VHLNVPFREPLLESGGAAVDEKIDCSKVANSSLFDWPADFDFQRFASGRGVVVIGRLPVGEQDKVGAILDLAKTMGWPVIADAASGARLRPEIIRHADWILHRHDVPPPERVLHFGGALVSKRLGKWLSACRGADCLQVRMFPERLDPWDQQPVFLRAGIQLFLGSATRFPPCRDSVVLRNREVHRSTEGRRHLDRVVAQGGCGCCCCNRGGIVSGGRPQRTGDSARFGRCRYRDMLASVPWKFDADSGF